MKVFLQEATRLIRRKAGQAKSNPDDTSLDLAAHLFAIGCHLTGSDSTVGDFRRPTPEPLGLGAVLGKLETLPEVSDPSGLYEIVIRALVTIEAEFDSLTRDADTVRGWTPIEPLDLGGSRSLGGEVHHWLRPESALARLRDRRDEEARKNRKPRPAPLRAHPMDHLRTLAMYWADPRSPAVEPIDPGDRTVPLIDESGRRASLQGSFRIALSPLRGAFHPLFEMEPSGKYFTAYRGGEPMMERGQLYTHLEAVVTAAAGAGIQLLMLPELTLDLEARRYLVDRIRELPPGERPAGVVAGSFHVWPESGGADSLPINETVLFEPSGRELLKHQKRGLFRLTPHDVRQATHFWASPRFYWEDEQLHADPPVSLSDEIREKICQGEILRLLETTLGRLVVLICADAIEPDSLGFMPVVESLRPDLLLVVAMSNETERFAELAERMAHHRISTLFVNAACVCGRHKQPNLAACDLALHQPPGAAATRVRWRLDKEHGELVEIYDRHPDPEDPAGWRQLSPLEEEEHGTSWLTLPAEALPGTEASRLGLVLDLGAHWRA